MAKARHYLSLKTLQTIYDTMVYIHTHTYKLYSRPKKAFQRIQKERKKERKEKKTK